MTTAPNNGGHPFVLKRRRDAIVITTGFQSHTRAFGYFGSGGGIVLRNRCRLTSQELLGGGGFASKVKLVNQKHGVFITVFPFNISFKYFRSPTIFLKKLLRKAAKEALYCRD